jgi:hypothetical protein
LIGEKDLNSAKVREIEAEEKKAAAGGMVPQKSRQRKIEETKNPRN